MTKIFSIVTLTILVLACQTEEPNKPDKKIKSGYFTIQLHRTDETTNLDSLFNSIKASVTDSVYFYQEKNRKKIRIGFFEDSFLAGQKAFTFFTNKIIRKYELINTSNQKRVRNNFKKIYFISVENERKSLFEYDLLKREYRLLWDKWGHDIVRLWRNKSNSIVNFSTALSLGRRAGFPFILNAKLYSFRNNNVNLIMKYGDGLQNYSYWENDSTFHSYYTYLDTVNSSFVYRRQNTFTSKMELVADSLERFDLLKDGFPLSINKPVELISPDRNYEIKASVERQVLNYSINDIPNGISIPVVKDSLILMSVEWTPQNDFCILSFAYESGEDSLSKLIVINLEEKKMQNVFIQGFSADFIVHGNLVIFDEWIDNKRIMIFDYRKNSVIDMIETRHGCGINRI